MEKLEKDEELFKQPGAKEALDDMRLLFKYCDLLGTMDKVLSCSD